jgi:hypothetical protein
LRRYQRLPGGALLKENGETVRRRISDERDVDIYRVMITRVEEDRMIPASVEEP